MIPRIIHYIWIDDNPYPLKIQECISSWKVLEDEGYTFMKWTRYNFDVEGHPFVKKMIDNKLYQFASDYIRLWALYNYGGIYMDTDVEVIRPFSSEMLDKQYLFGITAMRYYASFTMGCEKENEVIKALLDHYDDNITEPEIIEGVIYPILKRLNVETYGQEYFDPRNKPTNNTYTIHHYQGMYYNLAEYRKKKQIEERY